ncbi:MAG: serine/threonine-protein kinase PknK [Planctomycetes bacterium]|nr:serine/threonine-protein kinase PknK [Planctomycetota bacterium]
MGTGDIDDGRVPAPSEPDPWLGTVVAGRYAVDRELGWGSLGRVFEVRDLLAGPDAARLALKAVRRDRHTDSAERYLRHEYRCLSGLHHPHVVAAHTFDRACGIPFFILDAIRGETLVAYVARVGIGEAPRVLAEALRALAYLHQRGWLHLDIKPHNVLVDEGGRVRLIDLHLSRRRGEPALGTMRGTIAYMSPEVIRGREADPRADLYGLGAVAYEALCGSAPFAESGSAMEVLRGHATRAPLNFAARGVDVPIRLEDWVRCLLAKSPSERFGDAHETLRALAVSVEADFPLETEATRQAYLLRGPLVEREDERRLVLDASQALREGTRPAALLLTGEEGIGRTRLLDWLTPRLEVDGVLPLRVRVEGGVAGVLPRLLLRHGLDSLCPAGRLDLEAVVSHVGPAPDLPPAVRRAAAVTELFGRLAKEEHLALLIDDLGRADALSRAVVEELAVSETPLLLVACGTEGEGGEGPLLPGAVHHRLRRLTRPGAAKLIACLVGGEAERPAEDLVERLWELTAGNPRHLSEVVRGLSQDGALVDLEGRLVLQVADLEQVLSSSDLGALAAG